MEYANTISIYQKKTFSSERLIFSISLATAVLSIAYLLAVLMKGGDSSDLTLSIIQCVLGAAALHVPQILKNKLRLKIPDALSICFYIFVLCGTVLGEMFSLYYFIPIWDSILHLGSGVMAGMLGSILVVSFLRKKDCEKLISPALVVVSAICFALCVGVVWEIYEFAGDTLLGLNMQKCLLQDGTELVGKAAVADTMKDLIVDSVGAVIAAVCSALSLKKETSKVQIDLYEEVMPYSA